MHGKALFFSEKERLTRSVWSGRVSLLITTLQRSYSVRYKLTYIYTFIIGMSRHLAIAILAYHHLQPFAI